MFLHPMTVNFDKKELDSRYGVYHEVVKTSKVNKEWIAMHVFLVCGCDCGCPTNAGVRLDLGSGLSMGNREQALLSSGLGSEGRRGVKKCNLRPSPARNRCCGSGE